MLIRGHSTNINKVSALLENAKKGRLCQDKCVNVPASILGCSYRLGLSNIFTKSLSAALNPRWIRAACFRL